MKTERTTQVITHDRQGIECRPITGVINRTFDSDQRDYNKNLLLDWSIEYRAHQLCKRLNGMLTRYDVKRAIKDNRKFIREFDALAREHAGLCKDCGGAERIRGGRIYHRKDIQASIDTVNLSTVSKEDWKSFTEAISNVFRDDIEYTEKRTIVRKGHATSYVYNETFQNGLVRPLIRITYDGSKFVFDAYRIIKGEPVKTFHSDAYYTDFLCICN